MKRSAQWLTVLAVLVGGVFLLTNLQTGFQGGDVLAQTGDAEPGCKRGAPVKEFFLMTGEWKQTKGIEKDRGVPLEEEDGTTEVERYTFDPGTVTVNVWDCVRLFIHDIQGNRHSTVIFGTAVDSVEAPIVDDRGNVVATAVERPNPNAGIDGPNRLEDGEFARGEQILLEFTPTQPGVLQLVCEIHTFIDEDGNLRGYDDKGEPTGGPMVGYIIVLP